MLTIALAMVSRVASSRLVLAAALGVLVGGCDRSPLPSASAAPSAVAASSTPRVVRVDAKLEARLGIQLARAGDDAALAGVTVPGTLEYDPDAYAEVGPRLDGRVAKLHVRLGDRVKLGDPLAELVVPSLADAQAAVLVAQASAQAAEKNASREHALLEQQLTTAREVEVADAELTRAKVERAAAGTRLTALGADSAGASGTMRLVAPIAGVVVQRDVALGAYLPSSGKAFAIADTARLVAVLDVHEADLPYLAVGAAVVFRADGLPDRSFRGTLAYLDPSVGKTSRLVRARVSVPNPDGALRAGMFVRASIALTPRAGQALMLPAAAVQPLGADDVAFVSRGNGEYELRVVTIARRTPEIVEVTGGVARGELVAVDGAFLLRAEAARQ